MATHSIDNPSVVGDYQLPLHPVQLGIYLEHLRDPSASSLNMGYIICIDTPVDIARLRRAVRYGIANTPALNMAICCDEQGPFQQFIDRRDIPTDYHDLRHLDNSGEAREALIESIVSRPFNLAEDPLFRFVLIQTDNDAVEYIKVFHHIVVDGLSSRFYSHTVSEAYTRDEPLSDKPVDLTRYREYIEQEVAYRDSPSFDEDRAYWQARLANVEPATLFPADFAVSDTKKQNIQHCASLQGKALDKLDRVSRGLSVSRVDLLTAAAFLLEAEDADKDNVIISMPVNGRVSLEDFSLVCMTANVVHLYITSFWRYSIADLLGEIDFQRQRAFRHQRYPLADVLREHLSSSLGRNTLARVSFNWMPFDERLTFDTSSSTGRSLSLGGPVEGVSIVVYCSTKETLTIVFFGSRQAFDVERLQRYAERYLHILQKLIEYPSDKALASLALTTEEDLCQLQAFNGTESPLSDDRVSERFYATAADYPDARALVCGDDALTYRQLHEAASKLARYLIARSIGPDDVVGICLERSTALIIAMLGVVHSGAAYLPLDPAQPEERLRDMLEGSRAKQLITQQAFCSCFAELEKPEKPEALAMLILDDPTTQERLAEFDASPIFDSERTRPLLPGHLAYLIYTSGSTGKPKAVGVTQAGWSNLIVVESTVFGVTPEDRVLQFASMIFDASVWELSISLTTGATMIIASSEERNDHKRLVRLLTTQKVSYAVLPRAIASALSRQDLVPVRTLILNGDICPKELVTRFSPGRRMFNRYGPTESTVYSALHGPLDPLADTQCESVPIGRPIANTRIHLLDAQLRPVPVGVWGELYIAGAGLARGYVGRSGLTAERFIACPFSSSGTRMYRSGDLARWREDGVLEFGGRADQQIKLRGFRVEPGEIEAALCAFESIDQAVVLLREIAGESRLVAYLIPTVGEGVPDSAYLREQLGKTLPDYMIPAAFVPLESWPLTTSGKVNRKVLPDPEIVGGGDVYRAGF